LIIETQQSVKKLTDHPLYPLFAKIEPKRLQIGLLSVQIGIIGFVGAAGRYVGKFCNGSQPFSN
jgi:hypothetical protein